VRRAASAASSLAIWSAPTARLTVGAGGGPVAG
jgi:hypothetical protein